jgi:hypothetical protein
VIAHDAAGDDPVRRIGAAAETFRIAQLARASSAARAVAGMTARFAAGTDPLAEVIRERQDLAVRWQRYGERHHQILRRPPAERKDSEETVLRAALKKTVQRLEALDRRVAVEFPEYNELSNPIPVSAERVQQQFLVADEALLVYLSIASEDLALGCAPGWSDLPSTFHRCVRPAHEVTLLRTASIPSSIRSSGLFRPMSPGISTRRFWHRQSPNSEGSDTY